MFMLRLYKTIPVLLVAVILLFSGIASAGTVVTTGDLSITNYIFVSEKRVSRTVYEYTFQAEVTNNGSEDAENVVGTLTVNDAGTTVVDGEIQFGDVPAGSSVICTTDTLTIRMDMKIPFNGTIDWSFTKDEPAPPTDPPTFTNLPPLSMTFNLIPTGTFTMGSPATEPGRSSNEVQHQVTLTTYYMQTTEVTQAQWQAVMGSNPSSFSSCGGNCPVESVSWYDIQTFITNLNNNVGGLNPEGRVYSLPTEAQWEYAARAGTTTPFNTGSCLSTEQANFNGSLYQYPTCPTGVYRRTTLPTGSFVPNAFGLYDMHGNVSEWCQDWFGSSGLIRVVRGGGWDQFSYARYCRSANRLSNVPSGRSAGVGFRLVCSTVQPESDM